MEHTITLKGWFLNKKNAEEKVKHCPVCGSENITMPNDLIEWFCLDCRCHWGV